MKTHTPSLSGLPLCGEAVRWRSKTARAYRMAEPGEEPTCGLCLHLDGYGVNGVARTPPNDPARALRAPSGGR